MPSALCHFAVGATLAMPIASLPVMRKAVKTPGLMFTAGLLAVLPDLDTVFFGVIPYAHFFGHRGFFHSPFFGLMLSLLLSLLFFLVFRSVDVRVSAGCGAAFALALASHGLLDAMTDAGLGVMLLYPFSEERVFLPWQPFYTPPIKISNLSVDKIGLILYSELPVVFICLAIAGSIKFAMQRFSK